MDDNQQIPPNATPIQSSEVPPSPIPPPIASTPSTVDTIPQSVLRKHSSPLSFKSLSVIILVLLLGSVFVVSGLSSKKGSLDVRSRASKKVDNTMLQNGYFELGLLNWTQSKNNNNVKVAVATDKKSQGTKSVKIINAGGSDAYVYQDVKVEAGTWYTIRADALKSAGDGKVEVEVTEYDMVGGNPKFNPKKDSSHVYTGTDFQTRPMIFKTGKAEVALISQDQTLVDKGSLFKLIERVNAVVSVCTQNYSGQCGANAGCPTGEICLFLEDYQWKCRGSPYNNSCIPPVCSGTCNPSGTNCGAGNGSGSCPAGKPICCNPIYTPTPTPTRTPTPTPTITSTPTPTYTCPLGYSSHVTQLLCDNNHGVFSTPQGANYDNGCCKFPLNSSPTITVTPTPTGSGGGRAPTATPTPVPPGGGPGGGGCKSDKECINTIGANSVCQPDGKCARQGANCGTVCYDPSQGTLTPEQASQIDNVCNQGLPQSDETQYVCAASTDGTGRRVCWGDGCSAGGGGQGGGGTADKYVRVLLHMNKSGTAYFDNIHFEKGRVDTAVKIKSTPPTVAAVGTLLSYQLVAEDAERDFLAYGLGDAPCPIGKPKCKKDAPPTPQGASITQTGLFTFTPVASGAANIRLWASDGLLPGIQNLSLTVSP